MGYIFFIEKKVQSIKIIRDVYDLANGDGTKNSPFFL